MIKYGLCGVVVTALVTPALAANKFYVVRDTTTKQCSIVEKMPTDARVKVVGPVHKTLAMAEKTMKAALACDTK
jgi:hypothetical protein